MNLAYLGIKLIASKVKIFEGATGDPMSAQKKVLFDYLKRNKDTEYGRAHNFSKVSSVEEYKRLVPMSDCDSLRPYIDRMAKGEPNILTMDKPIFFGLTSGTTARQKLIPVTKYSRNKKAEVADLWAYYIVKDHPDILEGKILAIVNSDVEGLTESGVPYGAESGHGYRNLPLAVRHLYVLPYQLFDIQDYESRYYCILRIGMERDITTLATLNPSTIILLCQKIARWKDRIIDDIKNGTLNNELNIPQEIRKVMTRSLKANPKRALELEAIFKEKGELLPKYFWPRMRLIECWKGGTVKLYLKELPKYFGDVPIRDFGCLSTEARSSVPMNDHGAGGVLAINTNFYEFVPKEEMSGRERRFLLCDQLEKGREYFLIITTPGGLYRYNIDDIITVDGFFNKTPVIEFVQKGLHAVSMTGEKLYESHVNAAIIKAADRHGLLIGFFSACPEIGSPSRYIFLIEFNEDPPREKKVALLRSIEEELYHQNQEYEYVRKAELLGPPVLKVVRRGDFERYRAKKISEGMLDSQFKAPELSSDCAFHGNFNIEEEIGIA